MMAGTRAPATRSTVLLYARRLAQVRRGAALLTRKRQALIDELFKRARTAVTSREAIDAQARRAWQALFLALASNGSDGLAPLGWPTREIDVEMRAAELWGIRFAQMSHRPTIVRSIAARGVAAFAADAASQEAAREFEVLVQQLLDAAPEEHVMRRLGDALSRTTRLVNTLEHRVAVRLGAELARIRHTLAEREREEHVRIKRLIAGRTSPGAQVVDAADDEQM